MKDIKDCEYEVGIEEPNNVRYCERSFYIMVSGDIKYDVWAGLCAAHEREHCFICIKQYG